MDKLHFQFGLAVGFLITLNTANLCNIFYNIVIDERAIIELANAFQWEIDFAMDPRQGDTFKFVYEERYLNGEYVMPGKVLAGEYINEGEN